MAKSGGLAQVTTTCTMILGDCLEVMPTLPSSGIQMSFIDLPFGCTQNYWDFPVDLAKMWSHLYKASRPDCAVAAAATYRFSFSLVKSNENDFKYELVWRKSNITGFFSAKSRPLRNHELLLVFLRGKSTYNPQMVQADKLAGSAVRSAFGHSKNWGTQDKRQKPWTETGVRYPRSCFDIPSEKRQLSMHPTQKPVALLDWLIRTYSNEGDKVLDPTAGSFTTCLSACSNGRSSIGIERDEGYFEAGVERVRKHIRDNLLDVKIEVRK